MEGMETADPSDRGQTVAGMIQTLMSGGISEAPAREMATELAERGEIEVGADAGDYDLPPQVRERAQDEALQPASAASGGRVRIRDLVDGTSPPLQTLYQGAYQQAVTDSGLQDVELLTSFPVATLAFGYSRDGTEPGASRLVAYSSRTAVRLYGALMKTEGLMFRLDPMRVAEHLRRQGYNLASSDLNANTRLEILRQLDVPAPGEERTRSLSTDLLTLVHSYAHRTIRQLAKHSGIERSGIGEYLLPHHLAFIVYADSRSEFALGGLQAVFEQSLHRVLDDVVGAEHRCPLDPGCRNGGGACMACLHLGEPSCRWLNRYLDRASLFGPEGFVIGVVQEAS